MTSETPLVAGDLKRSNEAASRLSNLVVGASFQSGSITLVCGIDRTAVINLADGFERWADAFDFTPVECCISDDWPVMVRYEQPMLMATPFVPLPTENPASDLRDWLTPQIGIASIAAACGVSDRSFRNWLAGTPIRQRNAARVHQVRSIVQTLLRALGRDGMIAWLLTPQVSLGLVAPLDALKQDQQTNVLRLVTGRAARVGPRPSGPMIAESADEDFSSYQLAADQLPAGQAPRIRRRHKPGETSLDEAAR
jgi:hypothetical protein